MAKYPIKMLKDEEGTPFVPLVSTEALRTPGGETIEEKLEKKLEPSNLIAGTDITLSIDGNNITINNASKGVLIDNLTTEQSGVGSLDAHQGKVLKDMIPDVINNLTTASTDKALSAYQGYLLNHKVVPTGGTTGQVLKKSSNDDHALEWGDAADPNAIVGDGSIKKIIELTYEEYKELEVAGEIDEETEYHIADAAQTIQNLQDILDGLQNQIDILKELIDDIYYKPGDTINQANPIDCSGCITGSTKSIFINMTVSKSLANINTIDCTALTAEARGLLGYINSTRGYFNFKESEEYTIYCEKTSDYSILIQITKTEAYTNVKNNTPVTLRVSDAIFTLS